MSDIKFDIIARDKASSTLRRTGGAADSAGAKFAKLGHYAKVAALGIGGFTAAAAVFTYKVGSDYVDSLNKIQALTGSNKKTMDAAARSLEKNSGLYAKMGQTTGDAAAGVVELTKAGLSLHDSLKAVTATMVLAKAGELSVGDASTLVANSLNTFGLKAKAAGKLANELANAANISSADVSDLAESFKYVAPVAAAAGITMGQTSAILAELSNSGIKASQAGTTLRTFLLNLQAPGGAAAKTLSDLNVQIFDAQGNMKPLPAVIDQLGGALNGLPAQQKAADLKAIFGKTGISGAIAILKGGKKGLEEYQKGVDKAGAATKLANAKSRGLAGTISTLKADAVSAAQKIYREYSPALDKRIRSFVQQFKDGSGAGGKFHDALKNVADIAKTLWPSIKKTAEWTGTFLGYLADHKTELKVFAGSLLALKGASMAKNAGVFSLGKSVAGKALGSTIGGGVQKVWVVNPGFGGGSGGAEGLASKAGKIAKYAGPGTAVGFGLGAAGVASVAAITAYSAWKIWQKESAPGRAPNVAGMNPTQTKKFNDDRMAQMYGAAWKGPLKAVTNGLDSVKARAEAASRAIELSGPKAKEAAGKVVGAIQAMNGRSNGFDSLKQRAQQASQNIDMIGPHAKNSAGVATQAVSMFASVLAHIKDRKIKITADTSQAMANLSVMRYALDALHNKTIIVRAIGGHVPGEPTAAGGSGGGAAGVGSGGAGSSKSGFSARSGYDAGRNYMTGLLQGIANRRLAVEAALSKIGDALTKAKGTLSNLKATRAGFRGTFGQDSVFGQDFSHAGGNTAMVNGVAVSQGDDVTTPGTVADVLAFQKAQRDKAKTLASDVKRVTSMGLSKALVRQLRSQGASGAATLHALAQGSPADIRQLNQLDKQTSDSLRSAGMRAGNYTRGGSVDADIRSARKTEHVLELLERHLRELARSEGKGESIVVQIDSEAIIRAIHRRNTRKGVKSAHL